MPKDTSTLINDIAAKFVDNTTGLITAAKLRSFLTDLTSKQNDIWFVDSVNGLDTNDGLSGNTPFKTISKLLQQTLNPFCEIRLARNSYWREQLSTPSDCKVVAYGTGNKPVLDASDIAINSSFTLASGQTSVYQINWTPLSGANTTYNRLSVFENGKRMIRATSVVDCQSKPGSFYTINPTANAQQVVYINASDQSNISTSNTFQYEISKRDCGLALNSRSYVNGIYTRNNVNGYGSTIAEFDCYLEDCFFENGTVHNFFIRSGVVKNCIGYGIESATTAGGGIVFVCYHDSPTNGAIFEGCTAYVDPGTTNILGFYNHTLGTPQSQMIAYKCKAFNCDTGFALAATSLCLVIDCYAENCNTSYAGGSALNTAILGCQAVTQSANSYSMITPAFNASSSSNYIIEGFNGVAKDLAADVVYTPSAFNGSLKISNSTFYLYDPFINTGARVVHLNGNSKVDFRNNVTIGFNTPIHIATTDQVAANDNFYYTAYKPVTFMLDNANYLAKTDYLNTVFPNETRSIFDINANFDLTDLTSLKPSTKSLANLINAGITNYSKTKSALVFNSRKVSVTPIVFLTTVPLTAAVPTIPASCKLWLGASNNRIQVEKAELGISVTDVFDLSANAFVASQVTPSARPLLKLDTAIQRYGLFFSGTQTLQLSGANWTGTQTYIYVIKFDFSNPFQKDIIFKTGEIDFYTTYASFFPTFYNYAAANASALTGYSNNVIQLTSVEINTTANTVQYYKNGAADGAAVSANLSSQPNNSNPTSIGKGCTGFIYELMRFDAIDATTRQGWENYFKAYYQIA